MSRRDPVDKNLTRMELRRFQSRCEAQEGSIQRADTVLEVARLANIAIPWQLGEESGAMDAKRQLIRSAEDRARELISDLLSRLEKAEPMTRDKIRRQLDEEILHLSGPLSGLRTWAQGKRSAADQSST